MRRWLVPLGGRRQGLARIVDKSKIDLGKNLKSKQFQADSDSECSYAACILSNAARSQ